MSRLILIFVFLFSSILLGGCATDDHRRDGYSAQGGSYKDTHLRKKKSRRKASRRYLRKYAKKRRKVRKKTRIARLKRTPSRTLNKVAKAPEQQRADKETIPQKTKKDLKKKELAASKVEPFRNQKGIDQKNAGAKPDLTTKQDRADTDAAEDNEKTTPSILAKDEKPKEVAKITIEEENSLKESKAPGFPKEPLVLANKSSKTETEDKVEHQSLTMRLEIPAPDAEQKKHRSFNSDISSEGAQPYSVVKVYYATDRGLSGQRQPKLMFGGKRGPISYGSAEISIPKTHKLGEIETPSIWRMEFRENAKKHVILKKVQRRSKTRFFDEVQKNIRLSKGKNAFVFVHGYNIEFHEAALRTAQMAHDLKFDGVPLFYSWPSQGTYEGYTRDEANVQWTQANLKRFMKDFVTRSDAENIYLIAHSMGARALTGAVAQLVDEMPGIRKRIKEVMLAAPDIDAEIFKRDIAPKLVKAAKNITLYASADDRALQASRTLHGEPRAGDAGDSLVVVRGIDTIDASGIDTSLFGHAYFAEAPTIISDILAIIHYHRRPKDRPGLIPVLASEGRYWAFRKNRPVILNGTTIIENVTREQSH